MSILLVGPPPLGEEASERRIGSSTLEPVAGVGFHRSFGFLIEPGGGLIYKVYMRANGTEGVKSLKDPETTQPVANGSVSLYAIVSHGRAPQRT